MRRKQKRRKKHRRPRQANQATPALDPVYYMPLPVEDWCEIFEAVEQVAANQHKIDNPLRRMMVVITSMCNKDLKKSISAFRRYSALCEAIKDPRLAEWVQDTEIASSLVYAFADVRLDASEEVVMDDLIQKIRAYES